MAFSFDKDSGYGGFSVDEEGTFDLPGLSGSGALSPGGINQYVDVSYGDYNPLSSGNSLNKILEALNKANAYKAQNSGGSGLRNAGGGSTVEPIGKSTYVINRAPIQKVTGGTSGGLGSTLGGIAGTALSFIPGVGPAAGALLPKVGSAVGGLFG